MYPSLSINRDYFIDVEDMPVKYRSGGSCFVRIFPKYVRKFYREQHVAESHCAEQIRLMGIGVAPAVMSAVYKEQPKKDTFISYGFGAAPAVIPAVYKEQGHFYYDSEKAMVISPTFDHEHEPVELTKAKLVLMHIILSRLGRWWGDTHNGNIGYLRGQLVVIDSDIVPTTGTDKRYKKKFLRKRLTLLKSGVKL